MPVQGLNFSDQQIQDWFAANQSPEAVAQAAAQYGLNAGQVAQAANIAGKEWSANDVTSWGGGNNMNFGGANGGAQFNVNANAAGGNAQGGSNGMASGTLTTQGGKQVSHAQLAQFAASNPNDQAILNQAQQWGMSQGDIATALNNVGLLYNGSATSVQMNDPVNGSIYNRLQKSLWDGSDGYGLNAGNGNPAGTMNQQVTRGAGHTYIDDGGGSGHWQAYGAAVPTGNKTSGGGGAGSYSTGWQQQGPGVQSGSYAGSYAPGSQGPGAGEWGGYWDFSNGRGWKGGAGGQSQPFVSPTQAASAQRYSYGSWPSYQSSGQSGTGVVSAGSSYTKPGSFNPSDAMFGDYSNGW